MVTSRDVQEIVSKLSSDKAKAREVYSPFLLSIFFPAICLVAEKMLERKENQSWLLRKKYWLNQVKNEYNRLI